MDIYYKIISINMGEKTTEKVFPPGTALIDVNKEYNDLKVKYDLYDWSVVKVIEKELK